ncbi:MAG: sulfatase-like hydrolase/transferase, partial [Planctomycetes bacterium]|nr:sulfatase-like hydrolase/transferase [Planctomycetota bacterium]
MITFAALALGGCGDDDSAGGTPRFPRATQRSLRLLDHVDRATVSGMDALDRIALADANAKPLEERIVPESSEPNHPVVRSDSLWQFVKRDAAIESADAPPPIAMLVFALPTDRPVRLQVVPRDGAIPRVFAFRTQRPADNVELRDAVAAERVVRTGAKQMFWLDRASSPSSGDGPILESPLDRDPQFPTVVVGVIDGAGARVRIVADSTLGARLRQMRIQGAPNHVARAAVANDARESILLPPTAAVEWAIDLPADAVAVTGAVGQFFAGTPAPTQIALSVHVGDDAVGTAVQATTDAWAPIRVECAKFAGRSVKIRASVVRDANVQTQISVLAEPRIALSPSGAESAPDVLLVSLDTMRFDADRLAGDGISVTPALRALEREAVVFDQATGASSWTLPSHAAAFTGLYPDRLGTTTTHSSVPDGARLIAEDFRAAHYDTAAFISGGFVGEAFGFARGFDRFVDADPVSLARKGRKVDARYTASITRSENSRREVVEWVAAGSPIDGPPRFVFLHTYAAHGYDAPN